MSDVQELTVKECVESDSVPASFKIPKKNYLEKGKYPIIDQGETFVAGYTNDEKMIFPVEQEVVIFGDHTRRFKYVESKFCVGADGVKVLFLNLISLNFI